MASKLFRKIFTYHFIILRLNKKLQEINEGNYVAAFLLRNALE